MEVTTTTPQGNSIPLPTIISADTTTPLALSSIVATTTLAVTTTQGETISPIT